MNDDFRMRYARTLAVDGFEQCHQDMLCRSRVLIIGCGALGSQVALYLAGSGIGMLGLVDYDNIDVSNLQRQVAYRTSMVGTSKAESLSNAVIDLNPNVRITIYRQFVKNPDDVVRLVAEGQYDLIVEATDNAHSKRIVTEGASEVGIPCIVGGVEGWKGQVVTFLPGKDSVRYDDIFGIPTNKCGGLTPCSVTGVIGPVPGIVSSLQATEAIKVLTGLGRPLVGRILLIDGLSMTFSTLPFSL